MTYGQINFPEIKTQPHPNSYHHHLSPPFITTIYHHLPSFTINHHLSLLTSSLTSSSTIIYHQPLSTINHHLSSIIINHQPPSITIIYHHLSSLSITIYRHHLLHLLLPHLRCPIFDAPSSAALSSVAYFLLPHLRWPIFCCLIFCCLIFGSSFSVAIFCCPILLTRIYGTHNT